MQVPTRNQELSPRLPSTGGEVEKQGLPGRGTVHAPKGAPCKSQNEGAALTHTDTSKTSGIKLNAKSKSQEDKYSLKSFR